MALTGILGDTLAEPGNFQLGLGQAAATIPIVSAPLTWPGMPLTSQIGGMFARIGNVQPGFTPSGYVIWHGPYPQGQVQTSASQFACLPGVTVHVTPTSASQLAASDPSWWEIH